MLRINKLVVGILSGFALVISMSANAVIVFSDDFEGNLAQWTVNSNGGNASIGNETSNSGNRSLRLRWDTVTITSNVIDATATAADLRFWVRRGSDSFSENPENGENLTVQYLNNSNNWNTLIVYPGGGTQGEIFNYAAGLPADALHNGLRIRFNLNQGSGSDFDYWHVDDVIVDTIVSSAPTGLVAEWRFDELAWASNPQEVRDSSGNAHHGIAFNSQPTAGFLCNAADFTAAGVEDYIRLDHESLNGLDDWSISVWVTSNRNADQTILSASKSDSELNEAVMYFDGASTFWPSVRSNPFFDNNTRITLPYAINDGNFHHLVWTRDRSNSETCLYLDSSLVGCTTHADGGNTMEVITNGLIIGQEQDVVGGDFDINQVWVGLIDELVLFDNELNAGEVLFIYDNQLAGRRWNGDDRVCPEALPPATAYWRMDETTWDGSPGEVSDLSGNGLNMTSYSGALTNNLAPARTGDPGTCGYGQFDGSNSYLQIDHDPLLSISSNLSITLWMKPDSIPGSGLKTILSKDENYEFHLNPSGEIFWWWSASNLVTTGANIQAGNWYHISLTFRDGEQIIYINGVERGRSAWNGTLPQNTDPLQIGQDQFFGGRYFDGDIDEVRIFSSTLSHGQVMQSYLDIHPCSASTTCPFDFTDDFSVQSYGNNDGNKNFSSAWQEVGDNNAAGSGDIRITGGYLRIQNTNRNDPSIARSMDLSQALSAELRIDLRSSNSLEGNDRLFIEASSDGSSYTTLQEFRNDVVGIFTYDISGFISGNTHIRFRVSRGIFDSDEYYELNNAQVNITEYCGVSYFVINHDGAGINCLREAVSITAFDTGGNILTGYNGLVNLNTSTSNGNWFTVDNSGNSSDPAQGTLSDAAGDDNGAASYQFTPADQGTITLYFEDTHDESVNLAVAEGPASDDDSEGVIIFRPFGFVASPSPIATQVAGRPFNVQLTAAGQTPTQPECGVIEEYTGNKTINFWSNYNSPATSPTQINIDGTSIATSEPASSGQTVGFTNGIATLSVQYNDVGQIQFFAKDDIGIGDPTSGNSDEVIGGISPFVVRPFGYDISAQGNPDATSGSSAVYETAGNAFNMTLRSVNWQAADDTNNDGIPDNGADLSDNSVTPNIVNIPSAAPDISLTPQAQLVSNSVGVLGDTTVNFGNFSAVGTAGEGSVTFSQDWSEVGILTIDAITTNFMGSADNVIGSKNNIGRFIPASFDLTITDNFQAQCTAFSYAGFNNGSAGLTKTGQSDSITFNVQARNSNGAATQNYDADFAKLEAGTLSISGYDVTNSTTASGTTQTDPLPSPVFDTNGQATGLLISGVNYQFDAFSAPFNLRVDINAVDSDGVAGNVNSADVEQRLGRLQLTTSYGSEIETMRVPLFTEFFDGTNWSINTADNCTTYIDSQLTFVPGSYQGDLNSGETAVTFPGAATALSSGESTSAEGFWLSPPGLGNSGEVNIAFDLSAVNWLVFDWDGDGNIDNPQATVGFGRHRGSDRVIYWKEN